MPLSIFAIALGAFAVGTTEFVVIGLLPNIASDLGVSPSTAGLLVTGYAIGIAVGGPLVTWPTRRLARRDVLVGLMVAFALAHLGLALAPTFELLLIGRLLTASAHGAFFAVGAIVAAETVEPGREGRAIGLMFTGLTVATVIGVPLGTLVGQQTSWRVPFVAVAGLAAVAALAVRTFVRPTTRRASPAGRLAVDRPALLFALVTTVVGFGSQFIVFTFLAEFLTLETGIDPGLISLLLVVFGGASAIGTIVGGRAADRWPRWALPVALLALALTLTGIAAFSHQPAIVIPLLFAWGISGFSLSPALQARVVAAAGAGNTLASSLNISAFNVGIACGSIVGSAVVAGGGLAWSPVLAAGLTALAIVPAVVGARHHLRAAAADPGPVMLASADRA